MGARSYQLKLRGRGFFPSALTDEIKDTSWLGPLASVGEEVPVAQWLREAQVAARGVYHFHYLGVILVQALRWAQTLEQNPRRIQSCFTPKMMSLSYNSDVTENSRCPPSHLEAPPCRLNGTIGSINWGERH